jgi:hypothetical protein
VHIKRVGDLARREMVRGSCRAIAESRAIMARANKLLGR